MFLNPPFFFCKSLVLSPFVHNAQFFIQFQKRIVVILCYTSVVVGVVIRLLTEWFQCNNFCSSNTMIYLLWFPRQTQQIGTKKCQILFFFL